MNEPLTRKDVIENISSNGEERKDTLTARKGKKPVTCRHNITGFHCDKCSEEFLK